MGYICQEHIHGHETPDEAAACDRRLHSDIRDIDTRARLKALEEQGEALRDRIAALEGVVVQLRQALGVREVT